MPSQTASGVPYVEPTDAPHDYPATSKAVAETVVAKAGDTMTGPLTVPAPTADGHTATKGYVDALLSILPHKMAQGFVTIDGAKFQPFPGAAGLHYADVTTGGWGGFTAGPRVYVSVVQFPGGGANAYAIVMTQTITGASFRVITRDGAKTHQLQWLAVQMRAGSTD